MTDTVTTSPQIWVVNISQKNRRNQHCRQEFFVLATTKEEAEEKALKRADKTRTVIQAHAIERGDCYCIHC